MNLNNVKKILAKPPRCPLCYGEMKVKVEPVRKITILHCEKDDVAINVMDPLVGKWERHERVDCLNCGAPMRVFFTSTGFFRAKCVKKGCGATVTGSNPDRLAMAPALSVDGVDAGLLKDLKTKGNA